MHLRITNQNQNLFALSLSKGSPSCSEEKGEGFDKLSPNGEWGER